jgi:hypothetical protein
MPNSGTKPAELSDAATIKQNIRYYQSLQLHLQRVPPRFLQKYALSDTDPEIRASLDRLERATNDVSFLV